VANRVQQALTNHLLIEGVDFVDVQAIANLLNVIAYIDLAPQIVLKREKTLAVFPPLLVRDRPFAPAEFVDHFGVRQKLSDSFRLAEQN
jgi:hypothetical protein